MKSTKNITKNISIVDVLSLVTVTNKLVINIAVFGFERFVNNPINKLDRYEFLFL
jgi:hypothetical protein